MKPIKLAIFDLEGTIFRNSYKGEACPSLWAVLCNLCKNKKAKRDDEANRKKYYQGKYPGYSQWVIDTIKIHQKYHLTRDQFEEVINTVEYHPGVEETFRVLIKRDEYYHCCNFWRTEGTGRPGRTRLQD